MVFVSSLSSMFGVPLNVLTYCLLASWTVLALVETMTSTKCFRIKSTIIVRMPAGITAPESARKLCSLGPEHSCIRRMLFASLPAPNEPEFFLNFVINWLTVSVVDFDVFYWSFKVVFSFHVYVTLAGKVLFDMGNMFR